MSKSRNSSAKLRFSASLAILITAATFMLLISGFQRSYARKQIKKSLEQMSEMELIIKTLNIKSILESVELAVKNHEWEIEQLLPYPDSLFAITLRMVEQNPTLDGCCIAMIPDYYPEKGRLFEPYTMRRDSIFDTYQLGSEEHDYSKNIVFIETVENDTCYWSEPYPDPDDPTITLVTYTYPIHDNEGKVVGSFGVDLNAGWLGKVLNSRHLFPSSYNLLISDKGQLICGPDTETVDRQKVDMMVEMLTDTTLSQSVGTFGKRRMFNFKDHADGVKGFVYGLTPNSLNSWQIASVNYNDEIFKPLGNLRWRNLLLTLVSLVVFSLIIYLSAKNISKLQKANLEKERIDNELNIAKKIQKDMLPKPDWKVPRDDISICGSLVPAKIVGGDLFDHFVRDEKLFFCIGDVSGKGVPAALVMAVVRTLFHSVSAHESRPERIVQILNEMACQGNDTNMFITFFIGVLDLPTGKLRYCNAGHDCPVIIGKDIRTLPAKANLPLGVIDDMIYATQEEVLEPNETVFLYTDGLTEAMNANRKQFGLLRVTSTLNQLVKRNNLSPQLIINQVTDEVRAFVNDAEQSDDMTLLALQYTPKVKEIIFRDTLTIINKVSEITRLNAFVKSATENLSIEAGLSGKIKLAVEEAVTNVINYAYPNDTEGNIDVNIEADADIIRFIITDSGFDFDPTTVSKADTTLTVEERPIGGLGIFLVRSLMDSINYERVDKRNVLRMEKRYTNC